MASPNYSTNLQLYSYITTTTILFLLLALKTFQTNGYTANITVDPTGSILGSVNTVSEAIARAPTLCSTPFVIHITKGTYNENSLTINASQINLWIFGDGIGKTIITGSKSVNFSRVGTKQTATFSSFGNVLFLRDISFVNTAGPKGYQAVALYVEGEDVVVYRCEMKGYQDTLWTSRGRQFYRDCDIYGTVDFIFGDAVVVFQNSTMWARKPLDGQANEITAQGRQNPSTPSAIVFHGSRLLATPELNPVKSVVRTYLGRPWKIYARVVIMESYIGDHVDPTGWSRWNDTAPVEYVFFGEYNNNGPGSAINRRANWTHPAMSRDEASRFTVSEFIQGDTWINSTHVPYVSGFLN